MAVVSRPSLLHNPFGIIERLAGDLECGHQLSSSELGLLLLQAYLALPKDAESDRHHEQHESSRESRPSPERLPERESHCRLSGFNPRHHPFDHAARRLFATECFGELVLEIHLSTPDSCRVSFLRSRSSERRRLLLMVLSGIPSRVAISLGVKSS